MALKTLRPRLQPISTKAANGTHQPKAQWGHGRGGRPWRRLRDKIFLRDKYTCQVCGDSSGGNLVAHHLDSYSMYPDKRTRISNGITLCKNCHIEFHNLYGYKENTKTQFIHFIEHANTEPSLDGNTRKV